MTLTEKIKWMHKWCKKNNLHLELEGECGFGRKCVGVISDNNNYPDYIWYDDETLKRIDNNGDVWTPENAYHKHPCVAVLGQDDNSIEQLYEWLKWFDENNFKFELVENPNKEKLNLIEILLGKSHHARMVKINKNKEK